MLYRLVSDAQFRCHKHPCLGREPLLEPCFEAAGICFPVDPGHPQAHAEDAILLHPGSCQGSCAVAHGVLGPMQNSYDAKHDRCGDTMQCYLYE